MRKLLLVAPILFSFATLIWFLTPLPNTFAEEAITIEGTVINGTTDPVIRPRFLQITLMVITPQQNTMDFEVNSRDDGSFEFQGIPVREEATYFITIEHQGAVYSLSMDSEDIEEHATVYIYDATHSTDVLEFESHSIIITGIAIQEGFIEILERVTLHNTGDRTMVPNLGPQDGGMPDLLRFALPVAATNIDVRSTLVGGQILEVDRGFAITTPIPPTGNSPHQLEFIYRVPYRIGSLDLSRTLRFGAKTVRIVAPENIGTLSAPQLSNLGSLNLNDAMMRLYEGTGLSKGILLQIKLDDIPQSSIFDWLKFKSRYLYISVLVPSAVAIVVLLTLLRIYADRTKINPIGIETNLSTRRGDLLSSAALLQHQLNTREVSTRGYTLEMQRIQQELVQIHLQENPERGLNKNQE